MSTTIAFHAIQPFTPHADVLYNLDEAAHLAGIPRHFLVVCCKHGLVSPHVDSTYGALLFDLDGIRALQRIGYLYCDCGVNLTGIKIIVELMDEMERLRGADPR
jgi:DNA-binding transcriptional MerR regulator